MAPWTIFLVLCAFLRGYETAHPHTLHGCCEDGKERARTLSNCNDLPYISHYHACRLAQEQCCITVVEQRLCDSGSSMASWQEACERHFFPGDPWENQVAKKCCDCCMLGMAATEQDPDCDLSYVSLGNECELVARNCCAKNTTEGFNSTAVNVTTSVPEGNFSMVPVMATDNCTVMNCSQRCIEDGVCACFVGYRLRRDGTTCEDIDECLLGAHNCVPGQACINTEGSFRCQRDTGCGAGYELTDSNQCEDIDECALNIDDCGPNLECANTDGSFQCYPKDKCSDGFIQDAVGNCVDMDECAAPSSPCQPGHTCVNTAGSYICRRIAITCGRGYHLDAEGTRCEDVDECQAGVCQGHGCVNTVGTYRCNCNSGFVFNSIRSLCEDINECKHYPRKLCAHKCENTEGSYQCSCSTGFLLSYDGRNCEDVNECESSPCNQECANVYGSYQCYCHRGYRLSEIDGKTCEDIDECALPSASQMCGYRCLNSPGSFRCSCPAEGYTLASNGRTCQDIDECATGSHSCGASQSCLNIYGGYRCLAFHCPTYYRQAAHGRCDRVTCQFTQDPASCLSLPLGIAFYNISLPAGTPVPLDIFQMGPSESVPAGRMDQRIASGDERDHFAAREGVISLQRAVSEPRDFLLTLEMKLTRSGTSDLYLVKSKFFQSSSADSRKNKLATYILGTSGPPASISMATQLAVEPTAHDGWCLLASKDSVSVRCHKACHPNNLACVQDPVHIVTYTVLSLPTYRFVHQPEEIAFLRTSLPAHYANGDTDVVFEMLVTDDHYSYDVVKRFNQGYVIGVVRQVRPVAGPRDVELQVALNYIKSGFVSHRNIVVIYVVISEFWF